MPSESISPLDSFFASIRLATAARARLAAVANAVLDTTGPEPKVDELREIPGPSGGTQNAEATCQALYRSLTQEAAALGGIPTMVSKHDLLAIIEPCKGKLSTIQFDDLLKLIGEK